MSKLTDDEIRQHTQARINQALAHVQRAQDELGKACSMLSALEWGNPAYKKAGKLYDNVHAFWYVVDNLRHNRKVRLDRTNIAAIEQRSSQGET